MRYKLYKFCENRARDTPLQGRLYSRFWSNLSKNFNFGGPTPLSLHLVGPLLRAKFHPHRCNVSPLQGEKPQNRPLSKLNTGRFALRAMLPVIRETAIGAVKARLLYKDGRLSQLFLINLLRVLLFSTQH